MDLETEDKQKKRFANYANFGLIILTLALIIVSGFVVNNSRKIHKLQQHFKFSQNPLAERNQLKEWFVIRLKKELNFSLSLLEMKDPLTADLNRAIAFTNPGELTKGFISFLHREGGVADFIKNDPWIVIRKNHNPNQDRDAIFYLDRNLADYHEFYTIGEVTEFLKENDSYFSWYG